MAMVTSTPELDCVKTMFTEAMTKMAEVVQIQSEDRKNTEELMSKMIDKIGNTNITNNTNNFNINMFLNNQCKDAINFSDFIDRIECFKKKYIEIKFKFVTIYAHNFFVC